MPALVGFLTVGQTPRKRGFAHRYRLRLRLFYIPITHTKHTSINAPSKVTFETQISDICIGLRYLLNGTIMLIQMQNSFYLKKNTRKIFFSKKKKSRKWRVLGQWVKTDGELVGERVGGRAWELEVCRGWCDKGKKGGERDKWVVQ